MTGRSAASILVTASVASAAALVGGWSPKEKPAPPATAPVVDPATSARDAIETALDDERRAIAFYEAVMSKHGTRRPFSRIVEAERRHAAALEHLLVQRGLEPPADRWASVPFEVPDDFRTACDAAELAEIENVAVYDELLPDVHDGAITTVFGNLRSASLERHLPAFRRHGSGWQGVDAEALSPSQHAQAEKADGARRAVFEKLMMKLTDEVRRGGPASAIGVCRDEAPQIAKAIAAREGVGIGRTSWKLRNPANQGPIWARIVVRDRPESPHFIAARDGRLGAVYPIRVAAQCLACHGTDVSADVQDALDRLYPDDAATGFAEGDLRGWFWVEVPPGG